MVSTLMGKEPVKLCAMVFSSFVSIILQSKTAIPLESNVAMENPPFTIIYT